MTLKNYIKDFYRDMKNLDVGPVVMVLLSLIVITIGVGTFLGLFVGIMYLLYIGLMYVLPIVYAPAAVKLAELGLWGFIVLFILVRWVIQVVARPFRTVVIKAEKDGE